jgi:hypothetical protein
MIAISYRREDSTSIAGRLHDRLRAEFGNENVFMDFDSIPYGVDFRDHIAQTLERADIVVAVIGPGWLGTRVGESTRRIDDATDFVRLEIGGALRRGIPVIPILVDKTLMPMEDTLPDDLKPLVFRNALMLDSGIDFHHHADRLITGIRRLLKNIQSASRRGSKERSRSSPGFARDFDDTRAATGRFKWFGVLDRLISPAPSQQRDRKPGVKPTSLTPPAEPVTAAPKTTSAQSGGTEAGARETALPETSELIEKDRDFERPGGGANEPSQKQLAPLAGSPPEVAPPVSATAAWDQESSIAPSPPPTTPKEISAQPGGTKAGADETALSETSEVIEKDRDFQRYGGIANERTKEQLAPLAGSPPELAPPVTAPAVSDQESSIAPSPPPATIAQPSRAPRKPTKSFFSAKFTRRIENGALGLGLAVALIGFVTYFAVSSKLKSTSPWKEAPVQSPVPAPQLSPLITPESSPVPSATVATNSSSSASETSPVQQPTPSASEETTPSTNSDQTPMPSPSAEITTTPPATEQAPLAKNGRTWQAWIGDFVKQFVAANQSKDANATLALYAPTVDYFDDHQADQAFIRRDIEKSNERWPVRQDSIEGDIHLQEKVPDKEYVASFKLNFYYESAPRAIWTKGQFMYDLNITIADGMPKISGIRGKMLHQQKGKPGSNPTNNAPRKSYAYGIPIQGKPGFVRSPYAPSKGEIDIRRYPKGAQLKCPFTGKTFIAP